MSISTSGIVITGMASMFPMNLTRKIDAVILATMDSEVAKRRTLNLGSVFKFVLQFLANVFFLCYEFTDRQRHLVCVASLYAVSVSVAGLFALLFVRRRPFLVCYASIFFKSVVMIGSAAIVSCLFTVYSSTEDLKSTANLSLACAGAVGSVTELIVKGCSVFLPSRSYGSLTLKTIIECAVSSLLAFVFQLLSVFATRKFVGSSSMIETSGLISSLLKALSIHWFCLMCSMVSFAIMISLIEMCIFGLCACSKNAVQCEAIVFAHMFLMNVINFLAMFIDLRDYESLVLLFSFGGVALIPLFLRYRRSDSIKMLFYNCIPSLCGISILSLFNGCSNSNLGRSVCTSNSEVDTKLYVLSIVFGYMIGSFVMPVVLFFKESSVFKRKMLV